VEALGALRHHHIAQDQVRMVLGDGGDGPVLGLSRNHLVALDG